MAQDVIEIHGELRSLIDRSITNPRPQSAPLIRSMCRDPGYAPRGAVASCRLDIPPILIADFHAQTQRRSAETPPHQPLLHFHSTPPRIDFPRTLCDFCFIMAAANPKEYLDYLDKEMSIMGILSTFCVAAVALALDRIGNADLAKSTLFRRIWEQNSPSVLVGSGWLVVAALFFYLQRSLLAYYYGGISLSVNNPAGHPWSTTEWLDEADSWATWLRYRIGFICLVLAFITYGGALVGATGSGWTLPNWTLWAPPAIVALEQTPHFWILLKFRYDARPFQKFLESISLSKAKAKSSKNNTKRQPGSI
jgi:hypothetical protein